MKSHVLTLLFMAYIFAIGLGIGPNMSDTSYWYKNTWWSLYAGWGVIGAYLLMVRSLPDVTALWREHKREIELLLMWLSLVCISFFLSPYYSWHNALAQMRLLEILTLFILFLCLWDGRQRFHVAPRALFAAVIVSTLVVVAYFIYIAIAFPGLEADERVFSMRAEGLILNTHVHRIGYEVEAALGMLLAFYRGKRRAFVLFIGVVLFLFLFWLGGRAAVLGVLVAAVAAAFAYRRSISIRIVLISIALLGASAAVAVYARLVDLTYAAHAFSKTFQAGSLNALSTGRLDVWSLSLAKLQDNWLLGTGPQSYYFYSGRPIEVIHAHNFLLQFLAEWGAAGTLIMLVLLYQAWRYGKSLRAALSASEYRLQVAAGSVLIALGVTSLFSGVLFFFQSTLLFLVALVVWLAPGNAPITVQKEKAL